MAISEGQKKKLTVKFMMQGVDEGTAEQAANVLTLFRAVKTLAWDGSDISDEAAAILTRTTIDVIKPWQ